MNDHVLIKFENYCELQDKIVEFTSERIYQPCKNKKGWYLGRDVSRMKRFNEVTQGLGLGLMKDGIFVKETYARLAKILRILWQERNYEMFCRLIVGWHFKQKSKNLVLEYKLGTLTLLSCNKDADLSSFIYDMCSADEVEYIKEIRDRKRD